MQSKRKSPTDCTQQKKQQQDNDLFAAAATAAGRPNSSSSSAQQRRRRGSGGRQLRASEHPVVRLMTPWLGVCALTYASARGVQTQSKRKSLHSAHSSAEATTAQRLFAAAAAARQRGRPASSERASYYRLFDDSVLWWLHVVWVCHVFSVMVAGCVVKRVLCVVCWLFLATKIRTYVVMYVVRE